MRELLVILLILISPIAATDAIIKEDSFGCSDQYSYRLLIHFLEERDFKSFDTLLKDKIQHNTAIKFRSGEAVYIEGEDKDLILLSRPGNSRSFWTDIEAIRKLPPFSS
jgi:hypothetical protein